MRIVLDKGAYAPVRAHEQDAGLDLRTPISTVVEPHCGVVIDTGVHVELPQGTVGMIKSKSGLNCKKGIISEGVIDVGYTGSIRVRLYNTSNQPVSFEAGDKVSQLVILPMLTPQIEVVEELEDTERGDNGFGSSGR